MMRKILLALLLTSVLARADVHFRNFDDPDAPKWQEEESTLPVYPQDKDLKEYYVSATASNRYFVDVSTIDVGKDGVIRYTLVVRADGGAINVTREGIRCETREYRLYASGRADGTWARARIEDWRPVENKPRNRHHAALSREFFCPNGAIVGTVDEARRALRLGRNPAAGGSSPLP